MKLDTVQSIPCYLDNEQTPYGVACILFAGRLVRDRFNNLNHYSKFDWIDTVDPIPEPAATPLAELMDRRASELIGKSITAQWSGGVDSTSLLLALIKNGISKEDLVIFYDSNSLKEYPKFYEWLVKEGWNLQLITNWRKSLSEVDTDIITNGWCADQLFGSMFFREAYRQYRWPLEKFLPAMKMPFGEISKDLTEECIEAYKSAAQKTFGIDLKIAAELGWFINFSMKWSWVKNFNDLFLINTPAFRKTRVFYNTPYFQSWSLNNYPEIAKHNIYGKKAKNYKLALKEYCNNVFPDEDYLNNKTKVPSWNAALSTSKATSVRISAKTNKGYKSLLLKLGSYEKADDIYKASFFTKFLKQ